MYLSFIYGDLIHIFSFTNMNMDTINYSQYLENVAKPYKCIQLFL